MRFISVIHSGIVLVLCIALQTWAVESKDRSWTWLYRRIFTQQERQSNNEKAVIMFAKDQVPSFGQLVFSWNALRPKAGYFTFFVQARRVRDGKWGAWHKMMAWGAGVQHSYIDTGSEGHTEYIHVRLEGKAGALSDAFRIKIVADEGASLGGVHGFYVCVADFSKFKPESKKGLLSLPSVYIKNVPQKSQFAVAHSNNDTMCSPTSCSMLTSYFLARDVDPAEFAQMSYDTGLNTYGSWPFNMAHAFERCKGKVRFTAGRLESFAELHRWLQHQHIPVVVSVRGPLSGARHRYTNGHLLVVVGWDARTGSVICHDPASDDAVSVEQRYALSDFLTAWERSRRLAYLAEPVKTSNFDVSL
jgi:hypothetical protein